MLYTYYLILPILNIFKPINTFEEEPKADESDQ